LHLRGESSDPSNPDPKLLPFDFLVCHLRTYAVNLPPPLSFKHFDVSGIAETWKCRPSLSFLEHETLNIEPPIGVERLEPAVS